MTEASMMMDDQEEWRPVVGFPEYSVSSWGRVRRDAVTHGGGGSLRYPSGFLAQRSLPTEHRQVTICVGNRPITLLVHRMVAAAFLPPPPAGKDCVCHHDDDPHNNRPANLFWGSRRDNNNDKMRKGRQARGSGIGTAKLTEADVIAIRERVAAGETQRMIAADFGVSQSNISMLVTNSTWAHVQ